MRQANACVVVLVCVNPLPVAAQMIDNTPEALQAALNRKYDVYGDTHRQVAERLWRLDGAGSVAILSDWYYRSYSIVTDPGFRSRFVLNAHQDRPADAGRLIAAIVRDKRFEQLDLSSLEEIIEVVNKLADQDIVSDAERRALVDLLTSEPYNRQRTLPAEQQGIEARQVERTLIDWRQRVRKSVPLWEAKK